MAYIVPNSDIVLIKNMNLDPSYSDTIWFDPLQDGASGQRDWFLARAYRRFNAQSYTRVNGNTVRLEANAEDLYDVNYMMFRNTAYGNKWFYAFVLRSDYVNDNTTQITFEIDVMQTWLFEAVLEPCFVEREHSATDVAGDNLLAEPVERGDIICQALEAVADFKAYDIIIAYAPNLPSN